MLRTNIHKQTPSEWGGTDWSFDGWFDYHKAEIWEGGEYAPGLRTDLLRTKQGHWLYGYITNWQGQDHRFERITPDEAREWLIRSGDYDEDITTYFGELEEERGPGRPSEGTRIDVRLPGNLLTRVDEQHERDGDPSRAETIRKVLNNALPSTDTTPTLGSLLSITACTGVAYLAEVPLRLATIAGLYTAVTEDRVEFGLFGINSIDDLTVQVDGGPDPAQGVDVALGPLRYFLPSGGDPVERLCVVGECPELRLGNRQSTAFCGDHITGGENTERRLDALRKEAEEQRREGEGLARVAHSLTPNT